MRILLFLFIAVPIIEMWVLIEVGSLIGALPTIVLVMLTAVIGLGLLRQQGLSTLWRANQRLNAGSLPAQEIVEGFVLAVGGALLLTPGFVTDAVGFACLFGPLRRRAVQALLRRGVIMASGQGPRGPERRGPYTIDGDYRRED